MVAVSGRPPAGEEDHMASANTAMNRRRLLQLAGITTLAAAVRPVARLRAAEAPPPAAPVKGRIKQGICPGVLRNVKSLEEKAQICARLGVRGMDFVGANDWPVLKQHGLICSMTMCGSLPSGFNRKENHERLLADLRRAIEQTSAAGFPNVICFSGNRGGLSDAEGLANCAAGLKQIAGWAEEKQVNVCMELLNSKRNHKDYQCDHTAWGVEMCKRVGSPRIKLLYDIYHMQIMEGDIIATLRENLAYIGHIHTAGVPGRNEIDDTQELYYPAIMRALADAGYTGFVSHEYGPRRDPVASLEQAVRLCDA